MKLRSPSILRALAEYIAEQTSARGIDYLIPLEAKGALLLDLALDSPPAGRSRPKILYLRSLEYLDRKTRNSAKFGVLDDFVFSGRTIARAIDQMVKLEIPRCSIHPMAFFKFTRRHSSDLPHADILAATEVPRSQPLLRLSQEQILREVQILAVEKKVPASYDNLHWDQIIPRDKYLELMAALSKTDWFLYYGVHRNVEASAVIVRSEEGGCYSAMPKIRLWFDRTKSVLRVCPISFPVAGTSRYSRRCGDLRELLTPDYATRPQRTFASYQAQAFAEQVDMLGFLKPYFRAYQLAPKLDDKHLGRYFGPRTARIVEALEVRYGDAPELGIPDPSKPLGQRIDYYWVAVDIMRLLGRSYWNQKPPRKQPMGLTVAQIIDAFKGRTSIDAIHAAIDYCADMNFIATFFGWEGGVPFRAFRLTENGENEVGCMDGKERPNLAFYEKLGALILSKSKDHEAMWWLLEKVPAILIRRFGFDLPMMEVAVGFYGDTTKLRPSETSEQSLTWRQLDTQLWEMRKVQTARKGSDPILFSLRNESFEAYKNDIFDDPEIVRTIGAVETITELTKSKTTGHHVAILMDILSDRAGGATYLANSVGKSLGLIDYRSKVRERRDRTEVDKSINNWLTGLEQKAVLLTRGQKRLVGQMERGATRLAKQGRGDLAQKLLWLKPFPPDNRIVPALREIAAVVRRLDSAMARRDLNAITELERRIVLPREPFHPSVDISEGFKSVSSACRRWASALSAEECDTEYYNRARLSVPKGPPREMYLVAFDLIGSSGARYAGRAGADRDRFVQSVIMNWFIAFGGYAQRSEMGKGDLGYGFFHSPKRAVRASVWAAYHLELLKTTNSEMSQDRPHAGFGIAHDRLNSGFQDQIKSDWLSRFAKAWKGDVERIAETAGRDGKPIVAIHHDMFSGLSDLPGTGWVRVTDSGTFK